MRNWKAEQAAWQPMESAPLDGTHVILENGNLVQVLAHHVVGGHCIEDHPPVDKGWYFWNGSMFDIFKSPRRWRPTVITVPSEQSK